MRAEHVLAVRGPVNGGVRLPFLMHSSSSVGVGVLLRNLKRFPRCRRKKVMVVSPIAIAGHQVAQPHRSENTSLCVEYAYGMRNTLSVHRKVVLVLEVFPKWVVGVKTGRENREATSGCRPKGPVRFRPLAS